MNKGIVIFLIIVVLAIIAGGYFIFNNKNSESDKLSHTSSLNQDEQVISNNTVNNETNNKEKKQMGTKNQDYFIEDVTLNSGYKMPVLGIGTYALSDLQAENSVYWALKDGYRLIDTAHIYGNERGVGRGIKRAIDEGIVKREDIFVTTKMWTSDFNNPDDKEWKEQFKMVNFIQ